MVAVAIYIVEAASAPFVKSPAPYINRLLPRMEGEEEDLPGKNQKNMRTGFFGLMALTPMMMMQRSV